MRQIVLKATRVLGATVFLGCFANANSQTVLITDEEARLPRAPMGDRRAFFRGPEVHVLSPRPDEAVKGPFELKVRFVPLGGAKLDPDSLEVKYMVEPNKDITSRVKRFLKGDVLEIPDAVIPPGKHQIVVRVLDTSGRASAYNQINIDVQK